MSLSQIKTLRERRNNTLTEARSAFENITIGDDGYAEVEAVELPDEELID